MKYLFIPILFLSFFLLTSNKNKYPKNTNVILKISNLKEEDVEKNLINEFRRKSDIDYIDGSVLTKTVVLQVNERKFNKSEIEKYMQRWGLDIDEYVFTNSTSISDIEN
jgi:hypothetical protein